MNKEYVIIINGVEQIGFTLVKNTFDGAMDVVKEWKARGTLKEGDKVVIRTIITSDEEVSL